MRFWKVTTPEETGKESRVRFWNAGFLVMLLIPVLLVPLRAADFQVGMEAHERGDKAVAKRECRPLAKQGHADAQYEVGVLLAQNGQDDKEALELFRLAAEQGHPEAQYNLGVMHAQGRGTPLDYVQAYAWIAVAADQGLQVAAEPKRVLENHMTPDQMRRAQGLADALTHWMQEGAGSPFTWLARFRIGSAAFKQGDFATAISRWRPLAEKGFATVQHLMGVAHAECGNDVKAAEWFRRAAEQGHASAQNNLGSMYEKGRGGLPRSDEIAAKWYRMAASQGLAEAQSNLGAMYAWGAGVKKDNTEAYAWLSIAAAQGDPQAAQAKGTVAQRMTDEARELAELRAERYWKDYVLSFRGEAPRPLDELGGEPL